MALVDPIPSPVLHADFVALEWLPLVELVAGYAASSAGRRAVLELRPSTHIEWIGREHRLTGEVRLLLSEQVSIALGGLFDSTELAAKAQIPEAALEAKELQAVARLAHDVAAWQGLMKDPPARLAGKLDGLAELSAGLTGSLRPLAETIERKILPDGSLADDASPELSRLRREQERQQRAIEESLRAALRKLSAEGSTQEELITIRGERFVIPVRSELKRRVSGVVHGASSSGQTVYVEPLETIEQNNELVRLLEEEQAEIHRIFVGLTRQVGAQAGALVEGARVLVRVDSLLARARFGRDYDCVEPRMGADELRIEEARHPLLERHFRAAAKGVPRGLKPHIKGGDDGTTEVVPFQNTAPHGLKSGIPAGSYGATERLAEEKHRASGTVEGAKQGLKPDAFPSADCGPTEVAPLLQSPPSAGSGSSEAVPIQNRNDAAVSKAPAVVPLTLELTGDARQLVISGPNTGGKTVTLKTTALLAMMAQAGIPVPAAKAAFPVFTAFLADIGDAQSIEAELSTFSAHIMNLERLARLADGGSLVLLDELGSSTDPEEGAALAVAVAEFFLKAGAWTLISTHHTSLKVYGANTGGVRNAAAGVDERTLAPNYQLRMGVPGASLGIATAERLGLNARMVAGARERLGSQQADVARFLERLHGELTAVEGERKAARAEQYALNQERKRLEREGDVEVKNRTRELEQKLGSLLKDFEFQMRENVRAIEDRAAQQKLTKEAERRMGRLRREFQESFNQTVVAHRTGADRDDANAQPHVLRHVAVGDRVLIKGMGKVGVVQREVERDVFEVALGPIKMRVKRDELAEAGAAVAAKADPLAAARRQTGVHVSVTSEGANDMRMEINLIGRTVDEATEELEKYLDRAFLAGLPRVRVIHGHGAGILRRGVREFLKGHPHVATIAEAPQNEGGQGATLVELRQ